MRKSFAVLLSLSLCIASRPAQAQQHDPDGQTTTHTPGVEVLPLPNLPFTGSDTITWKRLLADGSSTITYETATIVRDSQGRLYRERHSFTSSPDIDPKQTLREFAFRDPTARTNTICNPGLHQCVITSYSPPHERPLSPVGPFDNGRRLLTRDNLGTQIIDGLSAVGSLETITIAPGTIGNDHELKSTTEFWYSSDLKTNLLVIRKDPREGTQTVKLTVLSRGEPNPSVFAIPSDYAVRDLSKPTEAAN